MIRYYSCLTGVYLGIMWQKGPIWYSENRAAMRQSHKDLSSAKQRLEAQEASLRMVRRAA